MLKQVDLTIMIVSFNYQVFLTSWCWFSVHTLNKFIRRKVVLEYFAELFNFEYEFVRDYMLFHQIKSTKRPLWITTKKFQGIFEGIFYQISLNANKHLELFQKNFCTFFWNFLFIFVSSIGFLHRDLEIIKYFFVANRSIKVYMRLFK